MFVRLFIGWIDPDLVINRNVECDRQFLDAVMENDKTETISLKRNYLMGYKESLSRFYQGAKCRGVVVWTNGVAVCVSGNRGTLD